MREAEAVSVLAAENARLREVIADVLRIGPYCLVAGGVATVRLVDLHKALGLCTAQTDSSLAVCQLPAGHSGVQHARMGMTWTAGLPGDTRGWGPFSRPLDAWAAQRPRCVRCQAVCQGPPPRRRMASQRRRPAAQRMPHRGRPAAPGARTRRLGPPRRDPERVTGQERREIASRFEIRRPRQP